jgi:hypothetical protein
LLAQRASIVDHRFFTDSLLLSSRCKSAPAIAEARAVSAIEATFKNGHIIPTELVTWPEGTRLIVERLEDAATRDLFELSQQELLSDLKRLTFVPPPGTPDSVHWVREERDR